MDNNYGGVIWTNHALFRLKDRGIKQGDAWVAWKHPDQSRRGSIRGSWVYYKTYGNERIEVVAKQNEKKQWLILSVWSKPLYGKNVSQKNSGKKGLLGFLRNLFTGK